jgi:GT2 family glycosyltransferase
MTKLSIVMPCHNRREALRLTLDSLARQTCPPEAFEVIVVDQASSDGSRELARAADTPYEVRLVEQGGKYGISVARNGGIEAASSDLVLLLDADLITDPGLVAAHLACQAAYPGSLGCGRVLPYPPAYVSFVDRASNPDGMLDRGDKQGTLPFYEAFGGHLSFPVELFRQVGPFDKDLRGYEDIDFAYRAHQLGYAIVSCSEAIGYHNHPRTLAERLVQARTYNRMLPLLHKRYPEIRSVMPWQRVNEPIDWRQDGRSQVLAKVGTHLLASPPVRGSFRLTLALLERFQLSPRIAKALYWRLWRANWYLGFREGSVASSEWTEASARLGSLS